MNLNKLIIEYELAADVIHLLLFIYQIKSVFFSFGCIVTAYSFGIKVKKKENMNLMFFVNTERWYINENVL